MKDVSKEKVVSTRPTHRRSNANLYPPERQLITPSEPSCDYEGGEQGRICQHLRILSQ